VNDIQKIVRDLIRDGWEARNTSGNHVRLTAPNGGTITVSTRSSGDSQTIYSIKRDIKRAMSRSMSR
jgi:predicted RNA binding protein YcfA (HicA-like mRNA interferase family)